MLLKEGLGNVNVPNELDIFMPKFLKSHVQIGRALAFITGEITKHGNEKILV